MNVHVGLVMKVLLVVTAALLPSVSLGWAGEWREGQPSSTGRALSAAIALGDEIYLAGGAGITSPQTTFDAYDTIGDIWRSLPPLPSGVQQAAMATVQGRIYLSGGYTAQSKGPDVRQLWFFDPSVGVWVQGPDMPGARAWHQMESFDGKLFVFGGVGSHPEEIYSFDPLSDEWRRLATTLPAPRSAFALAQLEGEIYVIGGRAANGAASDRVDIFNPAAGTWRTGPTLPAPRAGVGASVLGNRIHVIGGEQLSPPRTFDDHLSLSSDGKRWEQLEPLSTPRHGAVVEGVGDRLYVIGGATGPGVYTVFTVSDLVSIYKP